MCGICGLISKEKETVNEDVLLSMQKAIAHRGPDDQDCFLAQRVGFAFNRLSIVDIAGGNQPFFSEDGKIALICNGEIYNYRQLQQELVADGHVFRSQSDCEVAVHLYEQQGESFLEKLKGMFALALWDSTRSKVILARDRMGIKPLFFSENASCIVFASEIKGILASGLIRGALDPEAVRESFVFGYPLGEHTPFKGITQVPPASFLRVRLDNNDIECFEYWRPKFVEGKGQNSLKGSNFARRLADSMEKAVVSHLQGDVPISSYLSGGIDSTVVTTLMTRLSPKPDSLTAFSIKFKEKKYDESSVFQQTTDRLKLKAEHLNVDSCGFGDFQCTVCSIEQPLFSPLDYPMTMLAQMLKERHRKVALVGEGSDELFGGYLCFALNQANRALSLPSLRAFKPELLKRVILYYVGQSKVANRILAIYNEDPQPVKKAFATYPAWYPWWRIGLEESSSLFNEQGFDLLAQHPGLASVRNALSGPLRDINEFDKSIYFELKTRLPNWILWRADRNSMAHGVELRLPFLDDHVVEQALNVPPLFKLLGLKEKFVLRSAFKRIIPRHVLKRKKFGYAAPNNWLWTNPCEEIMDLMSPSALSKTGIFNVNAVLTGLGMLKEEERKPVDIDTQDRTMSRLTGILSTQILYYQYCN